MNRNSFTEEYIEQAMNALWDDRHMVLNSHVRTKPATDASAHVTKKVYQGIVFAPRLNDVIIHETVADNLEAAGENTRQFILQAYEWQTQKLRGRQ